MLHTKSLGSVKIVSVDYDLLLHSLNRIASKIKGDFSSVNKILLFGSFSKGDYTPESDVDILIIVENINLEFLKRRDLFIEYFDVISFDINLVVYAENEIGKMLKDNNQFIRDVFENSKELLG